jgi:hypothetical protein
MFSSQTTKLSKWLTYKTYTTKKTTYHECKQMQNTKQKVNKHNQITLKAGIL